MTVEAAMIATGTTLAEPATGETAWVSAGSYTVGDLRIRDTTHRVYRAITTHTGVTTLPESDATNWKDYKPTQRWAPFDLYINTAATNTTPLTYVLKPGFINAASLYGLSGGSLLVTYKTATGGTVLYTETFSLVGLYVDEWDYCFGPHRQRDRVAIENLTPYPECELTLTISADTGVTVDIGMIALGDMRSLVLGAWGGTEYGATVTPKTYSYIKTADDGTVSIVRRHSGTDMDIDVILPHDDADFAIATVQEVLDVPCAVIATTASGYDAFNVFGLISGVRRAEAHGHETIKLQIKGMI